MDNDFMDKIKNTPVHLLFFDSETGAWSGEIK